MRMNVDLVSNELLEYYFPEEDSTPEVQVEESNNKERWQPKKWSTKYEEIVLLDLMGMKGYEIAEKVGMTPQHVYNILATDEAIAIQKAMVGKVRQKSFNITEELGEIQELTVKRLKSCLKDDDTFKTGRLGFIAKGIDVMKGLGEHLKNAPTTVVNQQFAIPPSVADRFLIGLEKADEARKLRSGREVGLIESGS
jgi:hypothetical protein